MRAGRLKADLATDREVSFEEAEAFATKLDIHYYELSAKGAEAGTKVEETLEGLAYRALTRRLHRRDYSASSSPCATLIATSGTLLATTCTSNGW